MPLTGGSVGQMRCRSAGKGTGMQGKELLRGTKEGHTARVQGEAQDSMQKCGKGRRQCPLGPM